MSLILKKFRSCQKGTEPTGVSVDASEFLGVPLSNSVLANFFIFAFQLQVPMENIWEVSKPMDLVPQS